MKTEVSKTGLVRLIYVMRDAERVGPFDETSIREALIKGEVKPRDLAWASGCAEWLPLEELIGEKPPEPPTPPPSGSPKAHDVSPKSEATMITQDFASPPSLGKETARVEPNPVAERPTHNPERLIYILRDQAQTGPFDEQTVRQSLRSGTLTSTDLVWCDGYSTWTALGSMLTDFTSPPSAMLPPLPAEPPPLVAMEPPQSDPTHLAAPPLGAIPEPEPTASEALQLDALWQAADTFYRKLHRLHESGQLIFLSETPKDCSRELEALEARLSKTKVPANQAMRVSELRKTLDGCRGMLAKGKRGRYIAIAVCLVAGIAIGVITGHPAVAAVGLFWQEKILRLLGRIRGTPEIAATELQCKNCGALPPRAGQKTTRTVRQVLFGGWTCWKCHKSLDRKGTVVA